MTADWKPDHDIEREDQAIASMLAVALRTAVPAEVAQRHVALLRERTSSDVVTSIAPRSRATRRLSALAAAVLLVIGSSAVAAASEGSLPGDRLYPVNRALERVELVLARSDEAKVETHLRHATKRLDEVDALWESGRVDDVPRAAADATASLEEAHGHAGRALGRDREALLAHVHSNFSKHLERLQAVRDRLEAEGKASSRALEALDLAIRSGTRGRDAVGRGLGRPASPGNRDDVPKGAPADRKPGKADSEADAPGPPEHAPGPPEGRGRPQGSSQRGQTSTKGRTPAPEQSDPNDVSDGASSNHRPAAPGRP